MFESWDGIKKIIHLSLHTEIVSRSRDCDMTSLQFSRRRTSSCFPVTARGFRMPSWKPWPVVVRALQAMWAATGSSFRTASPACSSPQGIGKHWQHTSADFWRTRQRENPWGKLREEELMNSSHGMLFRGSIRAFLRSWNLEAEERPYLAASRGQVCPLPCLICYHRKPCIGI